MDRVAAPLGGSARASTATGCRSSSGAPVRASRPGTGSKSPRRRSSRRCSSPALNTPGLTESIEAAPTRDHLERLLRSVRRRDRESTAGGSRCAARPSSGRSVLSIPGDASAAAFLAVAALIVPGSEIRIEGVGVNPTRTGLFDMLREMGGDIAFANQRDVCGEPVADLIVRHSALAGVEVPPEIAPRMIDEYPDPVRRRRLRSRARPARAASPSSALKELDRIAAMAAGSARRRARAMTASPSPAAAARRWPAASPIDARLDHRIAMAFAVAGLHAGSR